MSTLTVRAGCPLPALNEALEDALQALAEGGPLTLREIAERSGWPVRTLYRRGWLRLRRAGLVRKASRRRYRLTSPAPAAETAEPADPTPPEDDPCNSTCMVAAVPV